MRILYIGDIMAEMGMKAVETVLPSLVQDEHIDFVVAQAENVTDGKGLCFADYERLKKAGVQAFTGGNHTMSREETVVMLGKPDMPVVAPANMPECPKPGYKIIDRVLVVSMLGSIVGKQSEIPTENPLKTIDRILAEAPRDEYDYSVVNLHGDFSSEKIVFAQYLDGRVNLVVGDHWHVQTNDADILPKGTARTTDVGMCGSLDSSLGVTFDSIVPRWRDGYQTRNILETTGRSQFCAVLVDIDDAGKASHVETIRRVW